MRPPGIFHLERAGARPAFSLVEAVVSTVIVACLFVAAMSTVAASKKAELSVSSRLCGQQLALDLMNEILQQAYADPLYPLGFGLDPNESTTSRALWDDVDDYNGWTESPPQTKNGVPMAGLQGWSRSVVVEWADPVTLNATTTANTGIKRITVTVKRGDMTAASIVALRTIAWADTIPTPTDATGNHPPVAVATGNPLTGKAGFTVNFDGTGSADPDTDPLSYVWTFGDGATGNGSKVSHTYAAVGTYTATLIVYDGRGGQGTSSLTITATP